MASMNMDASEVRRLSADLTSAGSGMAAKVRPVVVKGAANIKRQMRADMGSSPHFKGAVPSIDFTLTVGSSGTGTGVIEAEIGPKVGPGERGGLASIAYWGNSKGGGTVPDPQGALIAETPKFEAALLALLADMIR